MHTRHPPGFYLDGVQVYNDAIDKAKRKVGWSCSKRVLGALNSISKRFSGLAQAKPKKLPPNTPPMREILSGLEISLRTNPIMYVEIR
jgi:hypothetical protein